MRSASFFPHLTILAALAVFSLLPGAPFCQAQEADKAPDETMPMGSVTPGEDIRIDGKTAAERGAALVRYVATVRPAAKDETYPKAAAPAYAARLMLNIDTKYALQKLDAAATAQLAKSRRLYADKPGTAHALDPFDKVALVNTYFLAKDKIPKATAQKIRDYVALYEHKELKGYAKGAWNYHLMMDGAGYLAAQEWPELVDIEGLNAEQIKKATGDRLMRDYAEIARHNYAEYGAPIYLAVNLSAVRMVAEFAKDAELRKRAVFALDAMMLDIACTWNQGYNIGSASRAKYWGSTDTGPDAMGSTAAAAWVSFGAKRPILARGTGWIHSFWMATPGDYQVPELIVKIAQDRAKPFVHRSYVVGMGKNDVHRTTYHSLNYGLCSQWDQTGSFTSGLYKESRRNMLKWVSDKGSSTFAVCMENPYRPYNLKENKANALGYGENPFSQYLQDEGTLIGVYAVPENYPYYKLYVPFPTTGSIVKRMEKDGWIFCHNGTMLMGFRSAQPCQWDKKKWGSNDLFRCGARKNGWVLETAELAPFAGGGVDAELNRFAAAVLAKTKLDAGAIDAAVPRLVYTSLSGRKLELAWQPHKEKYAGQARIDGKPVDYASWPMLQNPWVNQAADVPILRIRHDDRTLTYDFEKWTKTEGKTE